MSHPAKHIIYTIGHSTHSFDEFLKMLQSFDIKILADIRSLPGSRKFPQFDKENLEMALAGKGIQYVYLEDLGGRRKVQKNSRNDRWRNNSFRGYADYMETGAFKKAILQLEKMAEAQPVAYMCAEAVWWRCHRSMVSDYLKVRGWTVLHIMAVGKAQEHPYTAPARVVDGKVCYYSENLFDK